MEVIAGREAYRDACDDARARGDLVGFAPTMGGLHEGHLSLVRRARGESGFLSVSIFVNPLQFGDAADLAAYPRSLERDADLCRDAGVDLLFTPDEDELYPGGEPQVTVDPGPLGDVLEGGARPGHFRGVCTVCAKLFALTGSCRAYFGEKDAQQVAVVSRMVADLDMPITVVRCPTVREADGLAMSSRNARLSGAERAAAVCLSEGLFAAAVLAEGGERDANVLRAEVARRVGAEPLADLDYVALVDDRTFEEVGEVSGPARALVAARVGEVRLIDTLRLPLARGTAEEDGALAGERDREAAGGAA